MKPPSLPPLLRLQLEVLDLAQGVLPCTGPFCRSGLSEDGFCFSPDE